MVARHAAAMALALTKRRVRALLMGCLLAAQVGWLPIDAISLKIF
jgi:hypothetical protein